MSVETVVSCMFQHAQSRPEAVAYRHVVGGAWREVSWGTHLAEVRRAGRALLALGVEPGNAVGILGFNRPEWAVMASATMAVGGAPAGIYTTSSSAEVQFILQHAGAPVALLEDAAQWDKVREKRAALPGLRHVVMMKGAPRVDDPIVLSWEEFLARGDTTPDSDLESRITGLNNDDLATLIYTSGTTGPPKGVMLSHGGLVWTARAAMAVADLGTEDSTLSYLPLSHIAEQMFTLHIPAVTGSTVWYAESLEKMKENLVAAQPSVFFGVPRVWEKFHAVVSGKLVGVTGAKATLVGWAREVATEVNALRNRGEEPGAFLSLQYRIAHRLVLGKLHAAMGLGRARLLVSGAAPIGKEVLEFMSSLDLPIREVYGQSEDNGPTSFNRAGKTRYGSVGPAVPGVEVKIASDGEILVRGPNVFLGYYKDPAATAETIQEGWLHSGDLGAFDDEGYLSITGRKKEILITAGGKNIAPKNIEAALKSIDGVGEAVVIGDRRKFLVAVVTLDPEATTRIATELGTTPEALPSHAGFLAKVQEGVDHVNSEVSRVEGVKRFAILPEPFRIGVELTPTMKVRRKVVNERHAAVIEAMYAE